MQLTLPDSMHARTSKWQVPGAEADAAKFGSGGGSSRMPAVAAAAASAAWRSARFMSATYSANFSRIAWAEAQPRP